MNPKGLNLLTKVTSLFKILTVSGGFLTSSSICSKSSGPRWFAPGWIFRTMFGVGSHSKRKRKTKRHERKNQGQGWYLKLHFRHFSYHIVCPVSLLPFPLSTCPKSSLLLFWLCLSFPFIHSSSHLILPTPFSAPSILSPLPVSAVWTVSQVRSWPWQLPVCGV